MGGREDQDAGAVAGMRIRGASVWLGARLACVPRSTHAGRPGSADLPPPPYPAQVQRLLDDESTFPTRPNVPFPPNFRQTVSQIFRRLFRVYAHTYHNHYERMVALSFLPHLNTCFKHFMCASKPWMALGRGGASLLEKRLDP
jgi:hypothetical protein